MIIFVLLLSTILQLLEEVVWHHININKKDVQERDKAR